jgi:hypothetical protein
MWYSPSAMLPDAAEPVIVLLDWGEVMWARAIGDSWYESRDNGTLLNSVCRLTDGPVVAWTHGADILRRHRERQQREANG